MAAAAATTCAASPFIYRMLTSPEILGLAPVVVLPTLYYKFMPDGGDSERAGSLAAILEMGLGTALDPVLPICTLGKRAELHTAIVVGLLADCCNFDIKVGARAGSY